MTWTQYIFTYLMPSWIQTFKCNFRIWKDLMTGNYGDYALMWYDDPYEECCEWFWSSLNIDETLPKSFLEHLQQMVKDIESGKVKTYPVTQDMFDEMEMEDLVGDLIKEEDDGDV